MNFITWKKKMPVNLDVVTCFWIHDNTKTDYPEAPFALGFDVGGIDDHEVYWRFVDKKERDHAWKVINALFVEDISTDDPLRDAILKRNKELEA